MADLAASDLTYTMVDQSIVAGSGYKRNVVDVAFGDGALTYPSGGVPLTKASLGCPNVIKTFTFMEDDAAIGLIYKYDASAEKIRMYEGDYAQSGDEAFVELDAASDAPAATTVRVIVEGW